MNTGSGGGSGSSETTVNAKKPIAYLGASGILWGALVELGISAWLKAGALGIVEVLFAISDVQVSLVTGSAEFLAAGVRILTDGPAAAVEAAWSGAAFETFGVFAPIVVIIELVAVFAVSTWVVRNL